MALEHKIYLDGNLVDNPLELGADGNWGIDLVRESGITSDDQILRNKTEIELTFTGNGYAYICQKKQENYCSNVEVKIYTVCPSYSRLAFIGLLPLISTSTDPVRKTVKGVLRDNSFSGLIRERQNNKVFLTATKSATGATITAAPSRIIDFFNGAGTYTFTDRRVWDVFEVMKWLIKQYTDDSVTVVSDYFTTGAGYNKYAITMGGMLYGGLNWTSQNALPKYFTPQVSFAEVFKEVRKKLRIYMSVDVDNTGRPTLRIEPESYFFSNTVVLTVNELPWDLIETYDPRQIYSEVKIGSKDFKVDDGRYYFYPQLLLDGWTEETYNNCSECVEDNALDLASEWIIDSNVIHFTLNQDNSTSPPDEPENVANADRVFLIQTKPDVEEAAQFQFGTADLGSGPFPVYHYNEGLRNREVFENWAGGIPQCVANYLYDLCVDSCANTFNSGGPVGPTGNQGIEFVNHECEVTNLFSDTMDFQWGDATTSPATVTRTVTTDASYFVVPADGFYSFTLESSITITGATGTSPCGIVALVFEDSTHLTSGVDESANVIDRFYQYQSQTNNTLPYSMEVSGTWENGNVIVFLWIFGGATVNNFVATNTCLTLDLYDIPEAFNYVSDDFLRKPIKLTFSWPICEEEWNTIQEEKRGIVSVNGIATWVGAEGIQYKPNKLSRVTVITNQTLCC